MSLFDQICENSRRRAAEGMNERAAHVQLVNRGQTSHRGSFVFPGISYWDDIEVAGQRVGYIEYGINPLLDRLYINWIEVTKPRQGIALSTLWKLWTTYQLPIVPIYHYAHMDLYWDLARTQFAAAGALIDDQLQGVSAMKTAKQRWQHLVPESEYERTLREHRAWIASEQAPLRTAKTGIQRSDNHRRR